MFSTNFPTSFVCMYLFVMFTYKNIFAQKLRPEQNTTNDDFLSKE